VSRELDALIAEKVMGCNVIQSYYNNIPNEVSSTECHCKDQKHCRQDFSAKDGLGPYLVREIPKYTTDISAAWEVLNKLKENYLCNDVMYSRRIKKWQAVFVKEYPLPDNFVIQDESAPLAICKAALKAVECSLV
jgi:hypothetical protein